MGKHDEETPRVALQCCEVMFLDFLGFSDAVTNWQQERLEQLIAVLVRIAKAQSAFDIGGEALTDGSYKIKGRATVTTFSDNIVASFPLIARPDHITPEIWPIFRDGWEAMVREQMQRIAAHVAIAGLDLGLLIRGGLSRGKLYHHGSVVIGEAMIDAYFLERDIADGSRVVASDRITDGDRLYIDDDGRKCLDFLPPLMELADTFPGDAKAWAGDRLTKIDQTIEELEAQGRAKPAMKWSKFRQQLADIRNAWPSA